MNRAVMTCAALLSTVAAAAPIAAAEQVLQLTAAETNITFLLDAKFHEVHGSFHLLEGAVTFDLEDGTAGGEIVIDATSAESGNAKRDKKMHKTVLESAAYPRILFAPQTLEGEVADGGTGTVVLNGIVTIRGEEHPISLPSEVSLAGDQVTAHTEFTVPYVDWGMKDPSVLFLRVAKEVQVSVDLTGRLLP